MSSDKEVHQLLDDYAKGNLSVADTEAFEQRMKEDATFREHVTQHLALIASLKTHGARVDLKQTMDEIHSEINTKSVNPIIISKAAHRIKRYWPLTAVAASVALISIMGTLFLTRSLETKQTANYKELRRNVDQIRQSQRIMMKDITEVKEKEKEKPFPGTYTGSGFLISHNGYVVTSYHVVKEADSIAIENEKFGRLKTHILFSDAASDISILKIETELATMQPLPYTLNRGEANLAEEVYTLGYPREEVVFGEGSVSALSGYKQTPLAYQVSVPVNPGNSGGPLFNTKGDLVGIISGVQTETLGAAFAIKSTELLKVLDNASLDTLKIPLILPKQNTFKNLSRVQQVNRWKDFVFMVRVYKN